MLGAVLTGLTFFAMAWTGQHVLRPLRVEVFEQLHRLSLSYYAEHEAGDLMSRITNDTRRHRAGVFSFALVNVFSGILLLVWIAYNMLTLSVPFALLSAGGRAAHVRGHRLVLRPGAQGLPQSRARRSAMSTPNCRRASPSVREVQAFNRADENIEQLPGSQRRQPRCQRRAPWPTPPRWRPTLEALGYLALAIVTGVGGWYLLTGDTLFGTTVSLGLVITFLAYVQRFNQPIQQIAVLWTNIQSAIAGAERIFGLLDEKPAVRGQARRQSDARRSRARSSSTTSTPRIRRRRAGAARTSASPPSRARPLPSSARPARARPPSSTCCRASTM